MIKKFRSLKHVELIAKLYLEKDFAAEYMGVSRMVNVKSLGYVFKWDNFSTKRFGCCKYRSKEICLSTKLVEANLEFNAAKIVDTILHEIAHAIHLHFYGKGGHDENWQRIAKSIGSDGKRYYDPRLIKKPKTKYTLTCPHCGREAHKTRKPRYSQSCGTCHPGRYSAEFKMIITQNY